MTSRPFGACVLPPGIGATELLEEMGGQRPDGLIFLHSADLPPPPHPVNRPNFGEFFRRVEALARRLPSLDERLEASAEALSQLLEAMPNGPGVGTSKGFRRLRDTLCALKSDLPKVGLLQSALLAPLTEVEELDAAATAIAEHDDANEPGMGAVIVMVHGAKSALAQTVPALHHILEDAIGAAILGVAKDYGLTAGADQDGSLILTNPAGEIVSHYPSIRAADLLTEGSGAATDEAREPATAGAASGNGG